MSEPSDTQNKNKENEKNEKNKKNDKSSITDPQSTFIVIGAGLGRTGTMSLKVALEILGFNPCFHMKEIILNNKYLDFWERVFYGGNYSWNEMFDKYKATTDNPACLF